MLCRLAWSSAPSLSFSVVRLNEIIAPSRRNNERNHIRGMLLFTGNHFLAILEGEGRDLDQLWLRLECDERHRNLLRIGYDLCGSRMFPEWMMAYLVDPEVDAQIETLRSLQPRIDMDRAAAAAQMARFVRRRLGVRRYGRESWARSCCVPTACSGAVTRHISNSTEPHFNILDRGNRSCKRQEPSRRVEREPVALWHVVSSKPEPELTTPLTK